MQGVALEQCLQQRQGQVAGCHQDQLGRERGQGLVWRSLLRLSAHLGHPGPWVLLGREEGPFRLEEHPWRGSDSTLDQFYPVEG